MKLLLVHFSKELWGCHQEGVLVFCLALLTGRRHSPAVNECETEGKCLRGCERDLPDPGQRVEAQRGHPRAAPG